MKSSFMLYILCMKISDPRVAVLLRRAREEEDPRLFSPRCASLHSLWIQIAPKPRKPRYAAYNVLSARAGEWKERGLGDLRAPGKGNASHARRSMQSVNAKEKGKRKKREMNKDEDVCLADVLF